MLRVTAHDATQYGLAFPRLYPPSILVLLFSPACTKVQVSSSVALFLFHCFSVLGSVGPQVQ